MDPAALRTGRCGIAFIVGGFYALWTASILLIRDNVIKIEFYRNLFCFVLEEKRKTV